MRVRRLVVNVAVVVLVLVVGAFLLVRWALDPQTLRTVAESRLTAALGRPVTVGTVRIAIFPSVHAEGREIVVGRAGGTGAPSLDIGVVRMYPRLSSIFHRPIVIDRVEIDGLALNVRRDVNGRWILPLPDPRIASSAASEAPVAVENIRIINGKLTITDDAPERRRQMPVVTAIDRMRGTIRSAGGVTQLEQLAASVGRSTVAGRGRIGPDGLALELSWSDVRSPDLAGVFALLGSTPPAGLAIESRNPLVLALSVDESGRLTASGKISADRLALGTLTMTAFESPARFVGNALALDPIAFRAYGGRGRGRLVANMAASPSAWTLDSQIQQLDVAQFVNGNTGAKDRVSGTASVNARLRGRMSAPVTDTLTGTVGLSVTGGAIRDFPLLAALNSALRIGGAAGGDLRFDTLSGTFTIADARAATSDLVAHSGELTLLAQGSIGFDQAIDLNANAVFSAPKSGEMIRSVKELSALTNDRGEIQVPVRISGTTAAPRFSIDVVGAMERAAGRELKRRLQDKLKGLFKKFK